MLKTQQREYQKAHQQQKAQEGGKAGKHWAAVGRPQEETNNSYSLGCTGRTSHRNSES